MNPRIFPPLTNTPEPEQSASQAAEPLFVETHGSASLHQKPGKDHVMPEDPAPGISGSGDATKQTISLDVDMDNDKDFSLHACIESIEKTLIENALLRTQGNKSKAAKLLKIDYTTLHYKIKEYGIKILMKTEIARDEKGV